MVLLVLVAVKRIGLERIPLWMQTHSHSRSDPHNSALQHLCAIHASRRRRFALAPFGMADGLGGIGEAVAPRELALAEGEAAKKASFVESVKLEDAMQLLDESELVITWFNTSTHRATHAPF